MASPLVATKLHAPRPRQAIVGRPRLIARLRRGAEVRLTLISAPAGFGKTTLLAAYLAADGDAERKVAWLSLDAGDNDPVSFWSHVIAALQTTVPGIGAGLLPALQSERGPIEPLLPVLLNELGELPERIEIVLDDYHVIEHADVHKGMGLLLDRLPPNVHVTIGTRSDPPLPLSRMRARNELVEVRSADLRFTAEEATDYLNGTMGLQLGGKQIATLAQRTEGWVAALQLAALSIEGRSDAASFIAGFAGNDRYVVDYLVEEVLQRQPDDVRNFLKRTCFLERLSGPLCDAVTGAGGGRAMLEALDRANLFVVPLDSHREWYRYHHLFADVLQTQFAAELSGELPLLHQRASDWYAQHGAATEAIEHALAAKDHERAATLIEHAIPELRRNREEVRMGAWIGALPDALVRKRPALGVGYVGALISSGQFESIEDRLRAAEAAIGEQQHETLDQKQVAALEAAIELYRAALAQVRGDIPAVIEHAQRSLDRAPADEHLARAGAAGFLGIAYWSGGDLKAAERGWTECRNGLRRAGHLADVMGTSIALSDISKTLGRLRGAAQAYEEALQLAGERGYVVRGTADIHTGLAELHLTCGDREMAAQHLQQGEALGELAGLPQHPYRWRVAMASLRAAEGDPEGALDLLDEAERVYVGDFFPNVRPIPAMKARIWIAQGRLGEAERWARDASVNADDALEYLREFEHITLARLLLAKGSVELGEFLDRLLEAAEQGGRLGSVIEIAILRALSFQAGAGQSAALTALDRALTLAEPEGYVRPFVEPGDAMAVVLKAAAKRSAYARKLLDQFDPTEDRRPAQHPALLEPLSEREMDVLRLLRSDLDGPEIARELKVSLNTMRTHTKNIYDKLGVSGSRAAERRAEELEHLRSR
jgi:LuxR family maltose regulon positive regulatory protein